MSNDLETQELCLRDEIRALRREIEAMRIELADMAALVRASMDRAPPRHEQDATVATLLRAIHDRLGDAGRSFTTGDVCDAAKFDQALSVALRGALRDVSPRSLGKRFGQIEGRWHDGLAVVKQGKNNEGHLWCIRESREFETHHLRVSESDLRA